MQGQLQEIGQIQGSLIALGTLSAVLSGSGIMGAALSGQKKIDGELSGLGTVVGNLSLPNGNASLPFPGPYIYTPTQEAQIVPIDGYKATQNITIEPIPENYGLITWNGSALTVS